jgi:hypothetical protein
MGNPGAPLLCLGDKLQMSTNPSVCLIKNTAWSNPTDLGFEDGITDDFSTLKKVMDTLTQNYWYNNSYADLQFGIIQNIYVNLSYVYSLVVSTDLASQDKKEKNDINLFDFLKNMMAGINTSIGNVATFDVFIDPQDSKARIIDVNYVDATKRNDAFEKAVIIEVHNLKSTVRSYSFESQIFPEQSSMIAIGAQVKGGALGDNVNTLVDFNNNLVDRVIPKKEAPASTVPPANPDDVLKEKLKNLKESMNSLVRFINQIDASWYQVIGDYDVSESGKYSNALKDIISYFKEILKDDNKNRNIIPTKVSIEMDGISGIVIGNLFRIPLDVIPRGYKGDGAGPVKLGYTVNTFGHSISGNDWKSKIEGQFIILDEPKGEATTATVSTIKAVLNAAQNDDVQTAKKVIAKAIVQQVQTLVKAKKGSTAAMLQATNAVYKGGNGKSGMCARYTYNIARDYVAAAKGQSTKGLAEGAGGNANDASYRARLQSLGYSMTYLGKLSRTKLAELINGPDWGVGDIINYCNKGTGGSDSSKRYGHTQIYTAGVQNKGNSVKWTSSVPANYGTSLVYRAEGPWEAYVFRAPA